MNSQQLLYVLGGLLGLSILGNIYLWNDKDGIRQAAPLSYATSTTAVIDSPYGYRSEVVTVYDNGQVKTYSTTTPVTEKDVEQMRKQAEARFQAMDEYFRKQEELFRDFWSTF